MSYGVSAALQTAVFQSLSADVTFTGLVGSAIYDAAPTGTVPSLYVSLGPEDVTDASDKTGHGARHEFVISVVSDTAGFLTAKGVAAAISDVLVDADLTLSRGRLIGLYFVSAKARRVQDSDVRRIDIRFMARVEDT
ncbi:MULTISPECIES: DUF3168 domain-containing protein [Pacificibacter]|uniref:DUF3168 domain-containing protein n=1 Tax=Pacificibacter TaxID=1042323 RepID=UPI001C083329|nr:MULTISPECIES: DUF3168 domain-containing protein [Pacificibacter]MBU2935638.1 DUF3168 domain-containing protein [Pacificibacter marinus]MDO6614134.1 DUF3168 domain-containing protein [Pacificibacter sp. 1_MG-2023]